MARPTVSISVPAPLFAGTDCPIEVTVTADRETKIDFIEATLTGEQGWAIGAGDSRVTKRLTAPKLVCRLMEAGVLPAATTTRFVARFQLPSWLPPTHHVDPAYARLRLRVHVSIPWRIDGRHVYELQLRVPPPHEIVRTPVMFRSTSSSSPPDRPRLELGLASTRLIAGEVLVGTCAVFHLDDRAPREVALSLVPVLTLLGRGRSRERRGTAIGTTITLPAGSAGTSVPFRLQLPRSMTPSFEATTHQLWWWVVARSGSFFGTKVEISMPIEIIDASAAATAPRLVAAPRLGDERVASLFARFAARAGWRAGRADDDDPDADQLSIVGEADGCQLQIAYAYRGEDGTFLIARVHHPSLGLGLTVTPSSSLRHLFFRDVEVDITVWDRAHHVVARDAAQTIPFLQAVVPTAMRCGRVGSLVRWSDDELSYEQLVANVDDDQLAEIGSELAQLAHAITTSTGAIAPPPGLVVDLEAWRALVRWLDGQLTVGDLSIEGKFDGLPVEVRVIWDGDRATAVRVELGDPEVASSELRAISLALAAPNHGVLQANVAERLVDQVTRWPDDLVDLRIASGVVAATYRLAAAEVPTIEVPRVRELALALRAVLGALTTGTGPYR